MPIKERYQSPVLGDTLNLDFYSYNNNSLTSVNELGNIEVYFLDKTQLSDNNPNGKRIKLIITPNNITELSTGHYRAQINLDDNLFEIGDYIDVWNIKFNDYDSTFYKVENQFRIHTDLRETHDRPFVYDVSWSFNPKKIILYSRRYLKIAFKPSIHDDIGRKYINESLIDRFYFNLKNTQNLFIKIELIEGCDYNEDCLYANIITDPEWDRVEIRGDNEAYYLIDSTEDEGIYNLGIYSVQFKILIGGQEIISPKFYLQILD